MKDNKYIDFDFEGSASYNCVMSATNEQLLNRLPYTKYAVEYHIKENNLGQVKFFTDELNLIKKKLKLS